MRVVTWSDGRVSVTDSVRMTAPFSGTELLEAFADAIRRLTLGLARFRDNVVRIGPLELLRFSEPAVTPSAVDWPIEGGLLARASGGHWRIASLPDRLEASVVGYRPRLPRPLYVITQLQVHRLFTRNYLLGLKRNGAARAAP